MTRRHRKSEIFTLRLTVEQRERLERISFKQGKKPSELVRDLVLQEIGRQESAA